MSAVVTVFGTSRAKQGDKVFTFAVRLGRLLAEAGYTVANGGYGGSMLAVSKGANEMGGTVIGVTCSVFKRSGANPYITEEIITENLEQRVAKLIELGDAYVVLPGGTGTLLELAYVWENANKGFAGGKKTIIMAGNFWSQLVDMVCLDDPDAGKCVLSAGDPDEVLNILRKKFPPAKS